MCSAARLSALQRHSAVQSVILSRLLLCLFECVLHVAIIMNPSSSVTSARTLQEVQKNRQAQRPSWDGKSVEFEILHHRARGTHLSKSSRTDQGVSGQSAQSAQRHRCFVETGIQVTLTNLSRSTSTKHCSSWILVRIPQESARGMHLSKNAVTRQRGV